MLRAKTTRFQDPDASGLVTTLKPEGVKAPPKIAPTSGRDTHTAFAPRNTGEPPAAGYAQTCTASTPVPDGAAASMAHPLTVNPDVTVAPGRGVSTNMEALDSTCTVTLFDCSAPETVLCADTTSRHGPGREAAHDHLVAALEKRAPECRGNVAALDAVGRGAERDRRATAGRHRLDAHAIHARTNAGSVDGPAAEKERLPHARAGDGTSRAMRGSARTVIVRV